MKKEMDAIRPSHVTDPKPSFKGKPLDFRNAVYISLSEVDLLNQYRHQHGGEQVVLRHKNENDAAFRAKRATVSMEYDTRILARASTKARYGASVNQDGQ